MASVFKQSKADFTINFPSTGSVLCVEIDDFEIEDEEELEAVGAVGFERPPGLREKPGPIMITVNEVPGVPPQVDWEEPKRNKEAGSVTIQYRGGGKDGQRTQYGPVFVSKVKPAGMNKDGESIRTITLIALGREDQ